jgi:hypothetical protein
MTSVLNTILIAATASAALLAAAPAAAGVAPTISLSCANGRTYALVPRAVTVTGDIVTARLYVGARRGVPVRLVPMGAGYRYAGRGVWLDGIRDEAVLNFGRGQTIACEISPPAG